MTAELGTETSWRTRWTPTPKWAAATIIGLDGLVAMWVEHNLTGWDATFGIAVSAFVAARAVAYVVPNRTP